jgi:hypothetical protein
VCKLQLEVRFTVAYEFDPIGLAPYAARARMVIIYPSPIEPGVVSRYLGSMTEGPQLARFGGLEQPELGPYFIPSGFLTDELDGFVEV